MLWVRLLGGNEREECVYGREEGSAELYPLTNPNTWVGELGMDWGQQSRVHAVEMSYLRGACGVSRWDEVSNESV